MIRPILEGAWAVMGLGPWQRAAAWWAVVDWPAVGNAELYRDALLYGYREVTGRDYNA